ncbi:anhydro-N-acetylmuramic acid kinase [Sulfobacillus thermosulfidooxidans]|uniref:anhydro-N-acetylmuramic acid kinase n=1 Tax=Sulfobacillus thermosulfidooxidans TaxID=28034 RepID=UPI0006B58842|nr:anhydro-N-acetylmuramic acid kinase [Sulfobacillus thermosulfidooxidans]
MHSFWAIGLMTGTSADGIDAALVKIMGDDPWPTCQLIAFDYHPFSKKLRHDIFSLFQTSISLWQLGYVHSQLARDSADSVQRLLDYQGLQAEDVRVIGFHGQTISHFPEIGFSLQIGDATLLAALTGIPVVSNFRAGDLAVGGQGAPLIPYFDYAMFRSKARTRVLLNIGGIANITIIPQDAAIQDVIGFDTGPGNMLIDGTIALISHGKQAFDEGGHIAGLGQANAVLVKKWMSHPYFKQAPPKSTGREVFGLDFCQQLVSEMQRQHMSQEDSLRTITAFVAESIAQSIRQYVFDPYDLIVAGGGMHNQTLMTELSTRLGRINWQKTDDYYIPGDAKEAMAFAYLAWQYLEGRPTNVPSVTGAKKAVCLGNLFLP